MALSFKNSKNSIEKLSTEHIDKSIMPTVLAEKGIDTLQEVLLEVTNTNGTITILMKTFQL